MKSEICNFAEDNTLYSCDKELGTVISNLKYDMTNILNWFKYNSMKANPERLFINNLRNGNICILPHV